MARFALRRLAIIPVVLLLVNFVAYTYAHLVPSTRVARTPYFFGKLESGPLLPAYRDYLEGAVRLGYRKELAAVTDEAEREILFREMVDRLYEHGKAVSVASHFEIDDVIDPADTRRWITTLLDAAPETHRSELDPAAPPRRPNVDTW